MGIVEVTLPAVAVTDMVRLILFEPQYRVTVPGVITVGELKTPGGDPLPAGVVTDNVTVMPDNSAKEEFKARTLITEDVDPSDFIDVGVAERSIDAGVADGSGAGPPPPSLWLPPQPPRKAMSATIKNKFNKNKKFFLMDLCILFSFTGTGEIIV